MKHKTSRERRYARLTRLVMLREEAEVLRLENMEEDGLPEDQGDLEPEAMDENEPLNDLHGFLALNPNTITNLE